MKFKHAFHVLLDNFSTTYKLLVYRLLVVLITFGLVCAVVIPAMHSIRSMPEYVELNQKLTAFWDSIQSISTEDGDTTLEGLRAVIDGLKNSIANLKDFFKALFEQTALIAIVCCCLGVVHIINRFLIGMGNYVGGAMVNDRMCLHSKSSFTGTFIKHLGKSSLYGIIYAPIAFLYDIIGFTVVGLLVFNGLTFLPILLKIFTVAVAILSLYAFKFTLTCNWLPAMIQGKKNERKAMAYSFNLKGKQSGGVFATAAVMMVIILAMNVAAVLFTFGAGLLITIPATEMMLLSLQFVNYFDNNQLKYFVDDYTIIGPKKEKNISREDFFKGEE